MGVHAPEFVFERERSNVERGGATTWGCATPSRSTASSATWNAYANRYWPAKYFIDRRGHVRFAHFGEGEYDESERVIRRLLAEGGEAPPRVASVRGAETASDAERTPETYLGWERLNREAGTWASAAGGRPARYAFPEPAAETTSPTTGRWRVDGERIVAGARTRGCGSRSGRATCTSC